MGVQPDPAGATDGLYRLGDRVTLLDALTAIEQETLCYIALGYSNEQLAEQFRLGSGTVRQRATAVYRAFGIEQAMGNPRALVTRWWWQVGVHAAPRHLQQRCGL